MYVWMGFGSIKVKVNLVMVIYYRSLLFIQLHTCSVAFL